MKNWIISREVADDIAISFETCQAIFMDVLGMKNAAAKIVPKLLHFEEKQCSMDIVQEMLSTSNDNLDSLKKVLTGDES